jgi:hypothetical protein
VKFDISNVTSCNNHLYTHNANDHRCNCLKNEEYLTGKNFGNTSLLKAIESLIMNAFPWGSHWMGDEELGNVAGLASAQDIMEWSLEGKDPSDDLRGVSGDVMV